jgi:hypothetical protein
MLIPHKELRLIFDSVLHFATTQQTSEKSKPFAFILTNGRSIRRLYCAGDKSNQSEQQRVEFIESGLSLMARQGVCTALGMCSGYGVKTDIEQVQVALEHSDGTAYRILLPKFDRMPRHLAYESGTMISCEPKFFREQMWKACRDLNDRRSTLVVRRSLNRPR